MMHLLQWIYDFELYSVSFFTEMRSLVKYSFHKRLVMACGSAIENNYVNLEILIIQKTELSHLVCLAWRGLISIIIKLTHTPITYKHISLFSKHKSKQKKSNSFYKLNSFIHFQTILWLWPILKHAFNCLNHIMITCSPNSCYFFW